MKTKNSQPNWRLSDILAGVHVDVEQKLWTARKTLNHPGSKGTATENVWVEVLNAYLPQRYRTAKAHVADSHGSFSHQIDVVVFDRQYSPFIFQFQGQYIVPAESVYAVFEVKPTLSAPRVEYAQNKVKSVRRLFRTSLPIPHTGGTYPAKALPHILGGLLTLKSEWQPPLGAPLLQALAGGEAEGRLDIGCAAFHGTFWLDPHEGYTVTSGGKPATAFLFELIARLQGVATVPMIDIRAYAKWLDE